MMTKAKINDLARKLSCNKLNEDLGIIAKWLENNRLVLNDTILDGFSLIIGPNIISFTKTVRLLGVMIDDKLKFGCHFITLCKQIAFKIHLLKKSSFIFNQKFRVILYKMFIKSSLEFCYTRP